MTTKPRPDAPILTPTCQWRVDIDEIDGTLGWDTGCNGNKYVSGGELNDTAEMRSVYTFCPACGKEIYYHEAPHDEST